MSKKLKILHLVTDLGKGGAERYLLDLCRELQNHRDIEFRIGSLYPRNEFPVLSSGLPIELLSYHTHHFTKANYQLAYKSLLESFQPDIIHTHRYLAEFLSSYYVNSEIIYICHGHDNMVQFENFRASTIFNRKRFIQFLEKRHLVRRKYRKVKCYFIANSDHTFQYFKRVLPRRLSSNVRKIECGFDFQRFYNDESRSFDPANKTLQLINVGSFQDKKNQVFLVEVARILKSRNVSFQLHFLGQGKNFEKVRNMIEEYGLKDQVFLHGNVDHVEDWMRKSDLYVHAALYEPFGLVFLEAMASGLPCITLDGKGNRDIIETGKNGILQQNEDPNAFVDSVLKVTGEPEIYHQMSEYGKSFTKQYDIKLKAMEITDFYKEISG